MKKLAIIIILLLMFMISLATENAHGHVRVQWNQTSIGCWRYSITKVRDGELAHSPLWKLQQQVYWCTDDPPVSNVRSMSVRRSHWTNMTWNWGGIESTWKRTLYNPTRYQFYVRAEFNGNGAYLLTEHNHPWIRMTIWKRNPTHVSYTAKCGC